MSLHTAAQHLASRGRGQDTMLVHMTPGEVKGLQALALKHGGSLTVNPETGLVEAGFLKTILPLVAGLALGPAGFGLMSAGMAGLTVGGLTTLATGSLSRGLMAGLGAYGGSTLGSTLAGAGANAASQAAGMEAANAAITPGMGIPDAQTLLNSKVAEAATANQGFGAIGEGMKNIFAGDSAAIARAGGLGNLAMKTAPLALGAVQAMQPETATGMPAAPEERFTPRQYDFSYNYQDNAPNMDSSERQQMMPTYTRRMAEGGEVAAPSMRDRPLEALLARKAAGSTLEPQGPQAPPGPPQWAYNPDTQQFSITPPPAAAPVAAQSETEVDFMRMTPMERRAYRMYNNNHNVVDPKKLIPVLRAQRTTTPPPAFADGGVTYDSNQQLYSGMPITTADAAVPMQDKKKKDDSELGFLKNLGAYQVLTSPTTRKIFDSTGVGRIAKAIGFNEGGSLGGFSDGGQMLKGPGDGVSDSIPAHINGKQPARLADNEFVIPARIVSEIGNGSSDAGARRLYAMMDRIQARRAKTVGKGKVAVDSKAYKELPA